MGMKMIHFGYFIFAIAEKYAGAFDILNIVKQSHFITYTLLFLLYRIVILLLKI